MENVKDIQGGDSITNASLSGKQKDTNHEAAQFQNFPDLSATSNGVSIQTQHTITPAEKSSIWMDFMEETRHLPCCVTF